MAGPVGTPVTPGKPTPPPTAGGSGAPHAPTTTAGHWVQQGGKWALIHAVGPGQWAQGPRPGFKAPPKPQLTRQMDVTRAIGGAHGGAAPGAGQQPANWLQPLTPDQVTNQATNTITSIYKPVLQSLDAQSTQESAIMAKQQADNQYYQQWLNSKSTSLQAAQDQVDQSTNALEQQLTGNMTQALGAETPALTAAANARPGDVSNNAPSFTPGQSALGNALGANQQAAGLTETGAADRSLAQERIAQGQLSSGVGNAASFMEAGAMKQEGDFQNAMTKIAATKATALGNETSSIEKEIARLQGVQIAVAQNNRNYATAAEKLGIAVANTNSEINTRAANTNIAAGRLANSQANTNLAAKRLAESIAQNTFNDKVKGEKLSLDQQKYLLSVANTDSAVALRNAEIYQKEHGGLTPGEVNTQLSIIDKASGELDNLTAQGLTPQQAYQALLTGSYYGKGLNSKGATVAKRITVPRLTNQSMLNAAYNLRQGGTGLTAGDVHYLAQLGIQTSSLVGRYGAGRVSQHGLPAGAGGTSNYTPAHGP